MIKEIGVKTLYQAEGREASEWVANLTRSLVKGECRPCLSSGLKTNEHHKMTPPNHLGCFVGKSNVMQQNQLVFFLSEGFADPTPTRVLTEGEGWRRAIALYSARKLSKDTWATHNDEYLVPSVYEGGVER